MPRLATATAATAAIATALALLTNAAASSRNQRDRACGPSCRAAYAVLAGAMRHDPANVVARTIVHTRDFDFALLSHALGVPSSSQILARFRVLEPGTARPVSR